MIETENANQPLGSLNLQRKPWGEDYLTCPTATAKSLIISEHLI